MPAAHQLPPPAPFALPAEHSPTNPSREDFADDPGGSLSTGVESVVTGLKRGSAQAAVNHLRTILKELDDDISYEGVSSSFFHVYPADNRLSLDYAYVALRADASNIPRPDLLEQLRAALDRKEGLTAFWRIRNGLDNSRRVAFQVDSEPEAKALKEKLEAWMKQNKYEFQHFFQSKAGRYHRLTYDMISFDDVKKIYARPPMFNHCIHYPITPRYIQPIYGLELAVSGVGGFTGIERIIMNFLSERFGSDAVIGSRTMMDGDVVCFVMKDFHTTAQVLQGTLDGVLVLTKI